MKRLISTAALTIVLVLITLAQPKKPQPKTVVKKTQTTAVKASSNTKPSLLNGQAVYSKVCIACHQKNGGGVPHLNPPLSKTEYVLGDKTRLIRIVLKGINTPLTIDDDEYTNPMPPQPQLNDQQIADVLTFVRNNFGNKASAITPAEVKAVRAKTK